MKTWQKIALGTGVAVSIGAIAYAVYQLNKAPILEEMQCSPNEVHEISPTITSSKERLYSPTSEHTSELSNSITRELDLCEMMDEVLVTSFEHILIYSKISSQLIAEKSAEKREFSLQIRKQCIFPLLK